MLLLLLALAQDVVRVQVTPQPMAVTRAIYGNVREMGAWSIRMCTDAGESLTLDATRVYMSAPPDVAWISPNTATVVLAGRANERTSARLARLAEGLVDAGAVAAGVYGTPAAGFAIAAGRRIATRARENVPPVDFSRMLQGRISLEPGGCEEFVGFAALVKRQALRAHRFEVQVLRRRPPIKQPTAIPEENP